MKLNDIEGRILVENKDTKDISELVVGAIAAGISLRSADLSSANLEGEILTKTVITLQNIKYACLITQGYMRLGCKRYTHAEWAAFSDDSIAAMDSYALAFWSVWKAPLLAMCAAHAADK